MPSTFQSVDMTCLILKMDLIRLGYAYAVCFIVAAFLLRQFSNF